MKKYFIPVLSTAVILSLFLFLIITITYAIPLVVDDYRYLTYSQQPDFSLLSLGEFIGRVPSYAIVIYSLLKLKFLTTSFFFFYNFFFGVHVLAIGLISLYVFEATRIPIQTESRTQQIIIGIGISALSFYPNFLEVVTWPSSTIYALGGVFLALALFTKNPFVRIILFAIAFGFYETYVLPGLALVVLPYFINFEKMKFWENPDYKGFLKDVGILVISVILIYSIKHYFSSKFGSYGYPLAPASLANLDRIYSYLTVLQFQSTEFENKLELAFIGSLSVFLLIKNRLLIIPILLLFILIFLSSMHDLVVSYYALRVLQGTFMLRCSVIITLIVLFQHYYKNYQISLLMVLLLFCIYLPSTFRTFSMKDQDVQIMEKRYHVVKSLETNLEYKDNVFIDEHTNGFDPTDFVIDAASPTVLNLFIKRAGIDKKLNFLYKVQDKDTKLFPRFYPCASMYKGDAQIIPDPSTISGEAIYSNPASPPNSIMMYGPYTDLEAGSYRLHLRVKCTGLQEGQSPGYLDICQKSGTVIMFKREFTAADFNNSKEYTILTFEVKFSENLDDAEFRGFYAGNGSLYFDYIKLEKL